MDHKWETTYGKATQVRHGLYALLGAAVAIYFAWKLGDPWLIKHFGSGAPWWVYALLFLRLFGGMVQVLVEDTGIQDVAVDDAADDDVPFQSTMGLTVAFNQDVALPLAEGHVVRDSKAAAREFPGSRGGRAKGAGLEVAQPYS